MSDQVIIDKIKEVFESIRPNIQMDGGDIEFVRYDDGVVYVRLQGACVGCPSASYTLKLGVEEALKEHVSEVREVVAIEDEF